VMRLRRYMMSSDGDGGWEGEELDASDAVSFVKAQVEGERNAMV
jgi:hypothetical protein